MVSCANILPLVVHFKLPRYAPNKRAWSYNSQALNTATPIRQNLENLELYKRHDIYLSLILVMPTSSGIGRQLPLSLVGHCHIATLPPSDHQIMKTPDSGCSHFSRKPNPKLRTFLFRPLQNLRSRRVERFGLRCWLLSPLKVSIKKYRLALEYR